MTVPFCKDSKKAVERLTASVGVTSYLCGASSSGASPAVDVVTGEPILDSLPACAVERSEDGTCGPNGKNFQAKL